MTLLKFSNLSSVRSLLRDNFVCTFQTYILSVNEKLPLLKFRYFENYKRNLDSYFPFHVSGQLQTRLEQ